MKIRLALVAIAVIFIAAFAMTFAIAADAPSTQPAATEPAANGLDKSFQLLDVDGKPRQPLQTAQTDSAKGVVFLFIAVDCPISNSYAPEIKRLIDRYSKAGGHNVGEGSFDFYLVHSDADLSPAAAKKHASDFGYTCPVLMDPKETLCKQLGATVTPEVCIVAPDGKLLYRGRIDNWYADFGKQRIAPTTHDLSDALDALSAGRAPANARTEAVGCPI